MTKKEEFFGENQKTVQASDRKISSKNDKNPHTQTQIKSVEGRNGGNLKIKKDREMEGNQRVL